MEMFIFRQDNKRIFVYIPDAGLLFSPATSPDDTRFSVAKLRVAKRKKSPIFMSIFDMADKCLKDSAVRKMKVTDARTTFLVKYVAENTRSFTIIPPRSEAHQILHDLCAEFDPTSAKGNQPTTQKKLFAYADPHFRPTFYIPGKLLILWDRDAQAFVVWKGLPARKAQGKENPEKKRFDDADAFIRDPTKKKMEMTAGAAGDLIASTLTLKSGSHFHPGLQSYKILMYLHTEMASTLAGNR